MIYTYKQLIEKNIPVQADAKDFEHVQDLIGKARNILHDLVNSDLPSESDRRAVISFFGAISEAFDYCDMVMDHMIDWQFETRKKEGKAAADLEKRMRQKERYYRITIYGKYSFCVCEHLALDMFKQACNCYEGEAEISILGVDGLPEVDDIGQICEIVSASMEAAWQSPF